MTTITPAEQKTHKFSKDQATQLGRMSDAMAGGSGRWGKAAPLRAKLLATYKDMSADALRARVNIQTMVSGTPTYTSENDYTSEEQGWIAAWGVQSNPQKEIGRRVALATVMKAEGVGTVTIKAALSGP